MPRTPYDFNIAGICHKSRPDGSDPVDQLTSASRHTEEVSGTSRRKPKGFLAPTGYHFFHRTIAYATGTANLRYKPDPNGPIGGVNSGVVGGLFGAFDTREHFINYDEDHIEPAEVRNRALIKARNALKQTDVNLGVAFAERSATARLVGDTAVRLAQSYRSLRRGQTRRAMDILGITSARNEPRGSNAPQKWLELQYGWKPLLSDVYGACDALSGRDKSDWSVTAKGRASISTRYEKRFPYVGGADVTASGTTSCYVRIDALPENEALISLASLGITNPLLIGWELVPFSFVVDWFVPVGGFLESLDALLGYSTFDYSSSLLTRKSWSGVGRSMTEGLFIYENSFTESKSVVRLDRDVGTSVPFPHFPGFKDPRSLEHMANGLSLLAVVFGRK